MLWVVIHLKQKLISLDASRHPLEVVTEKLVYIRLALSCHGPDFVAVLNHQLAIAFVIHMNKVPFLNSMNNNNKNSKSAKKIPI